jgi:hypothetical protein
MAVGAPGHGLPVWQKIVYYTGGTPAPALKAVKSSPVETPEMEKPK